MSPVLGSFLSLLGAFGIGVAFGAVVVYKTVSDYWIGNGLYNRVEQGGVLYEVKRMD